MKQVHLAALLFFLCFHFLTNLSAQNTKKWKQEKRKEGRLALVIGNANYPIQNTLCFNNGVCPPINDANDMAAALRDLGFEIIKKINLGNREMQDILDEFGNKLRTGNYKVAMVHFSGHGSEVGGSNYLYPVDASPEHESDTRFECIDVNKVLGKMQTHKVETRILLLDACRDNPFEKAWSRSSSDKGLGYISAPNGTFIGYATSPNEVASNRSSNGRNGLYTQAILEHIKKPNQSIDAIFTKVSNSVQNVRDNQIPFKLSNLKHDFYFAKSDDSIQSPTPSPRPSPDIPERMIQVTGGNFTMGCTTEQGGDCFIDENPTREVYVSDFLIDQYEVTVKDFRKFVKSTRYQTSAEIEGNYHFYDKEYEEWTDKEGVDWKRPHFKNYIQMNNHPVVHVSWYDAVAFCNWRSEAEGLSPYYNIDSDSVTTNTDTKGYRLPTEAEWEYAARGGQARQGYKNSGANDAETVAVYGNSHTIRVGSKAPNELGIYDMSGNVWEWCQDWYGEDYYNEQENNNPQGPEKGSVRVLRGGSWKSYVSNCRVSDRLYFNPILSDNYLGFRCARAL